MTIEYDVNTITRDQSVANVLEVYNEGWAPLSTWTTEHILAMIEAFEAELEDRGQQVLATDVDLDDGTLGYN